MQKECYSNHLYLTRYSMSHCLRRVGWPLSDCVYIDLLRDDILLTDPFVKSAEVHGMSNRWCWEYKNLCYHSVLQELAPLERAQSTAIRPLTLIAWTINGLYHFLRNSLCAGSHSSSTHCFYFWMKCSVYSCCLLWRFGYRISDVKLLRAESFWFGLCLLPNLAV